MVYFRDFAYNAYNWKYCIYKRERRCSNIFTFDIETTSVFVKDGKVYPFDTKRPHKPSEWYDDTIKVGFCYIWMFGIDDNVVYGRHLDDFLPWLKNLVDEIIQAKICCYIHNAGFEFNFLRNFLSSDVKVFARKKRRPIYFADGDIEFRCSYMLTRLSLAKWATAKKLPVKKLEGDLDYTIIRTPLTPLDKVSLSYCKNDILVMYYGLQQFVSRYGNVWSIPLTQTGEVRREFNDILKNRDDLHKRMRRLVIDNLDLYRLLLQCFWGGIAHANMLWSMQLLSDLDAWDFKSSYPWAMVSEKYPVTPFVKAEYREEYECDNYSYIITVELHDIKSALWNTYLSLSKCSKIILPVDDNGRLLAAKYVLITCTNVDWHNIQKSYHISSYDILDFRVAINDYLDDDICKYILQLFANKTLLDGVTGEEDNYAKSKEFINSMFGMMVTREITDDVIYRDDEWTLKQLTDVIFNTKVARKKKQLSKLNTALQIGVWVTAYARNNLWSIVLQLDDYTAYLDTDSDKLVNGYDIDVIHNYNKKVEEKQEEIAKRLGIDISMLRPISPNGKQASLGIFAYEAHYKQFKTIGSKKYIYKTDDDKLHMTVSGVRKDAVSQLNDISDFDVGYTFDIDNSKKLLLHYNDDQPIGLVINAGKKDEWVMRYKYGICMQPTTYTLGVTDFYEKTFIDILNEKSRILEIDALLEKVIENAKKRRVIEDAKKKRKGDRKERTL